MDKKYGLLSIGNAIVDIISVANDKHIQDLFLVKGGMSMISSEKLGLFYENSKNNLIVAGGSSANSAVMFSCLGGKAFFLGKVGKDEFGKYFINDMKKYQVDMPEKFSDENSSRCFVFISDDRKERTMATYLGASLEFNDQDLNNDAFWQADIMLIESYLFYNEKAKNFIFKSIDNAKNFGTKVALSLSDPMCVTNNKNIINDILPNIDILLGNQQEYSNLFEIQDLEEIIDKTKNILPIAAITRGEEGAVAIEHNGKVSYVTANKNVNLVDVTGAGDAFAAGFLYGIYSKKSLDFSAKLGCLVAEETISHIGSKPMTNLRIIYENFLKS